MTTEDDALAAALRDQAGAMQPGDASFTRLVPPPDLFWNLLPDKSLILVSAEPFVGKTMLLLHAALCLDTSAPLLGHYQPRESKLVVFCGQDAPAYDYARQLRKLAHPRDLALSEITLLLNRNRHLLEPAFGAWLAAYHAATHFDVLILDTLMSFAAGIDENSNTDMGRVMDTLKRWRDELGIAILTSLHTNKSLLATSANYRVRGASIIAGSCDAHLQVLLRKTWTPTPPATSTVVMLGLSLPKGRGVSTEIPPCTLVHDATSARFICDMPFHDLLLAWLPASPTALWHRARRLGKPKSTLDQALVELANLGHITRIQDGTWARS